MREEWSVVSYSRIDDEGHKSSRYRLRERGSGTKT
jgi:hypothetical protein